MSSESTVDNFSKLIEDDKIKTDSIVSKLAEEEEKVFEEMKQLSLLSSTKDVLDRLLWNGGDVENIDKKMLQTIVALFFRWLFGTEKFCQIIYYFNILYVNVKSEDDIERIVYYIAGSALNTVHKDCSDCNRSDCKSKHGANHRRAGYFLLKSAERGLLSGIFSYSVLLHPGIKCECDLLSCIDKNEIENIEESIKWCKIAAEKGFSKCQYNLALYYRGLKKYKECLELLTNLLKKESYESDVNGILFSVKMDMCNYGEAIELLLKRVEKGDAWAMCNYATILWGKKIPQCDFKFDAVLENLGILDQIKDNKTSRFELGLNLMCHIARREKSDIDEECLELIEKYIPNNDEQMVANLCGLGNWPRFDIEKDNIGSCLDFAHDRQGVLGKVARYHRDKKNIVSHFVYTYGLDWHQYYEKYPITSDEELKSFQHVDEQHHQLLNLSNDFPCDNFPCNNFPREICEIVLSFLPWFPLVKKGRKRKFDFF
jgi:tetratricopeptide (TPR) repeat protein